MNINKYNFRTDLACDEKDCVSNRLLETIETFNNIEVYKHIVNDDANIVNKRSGTYYSIDLKNINYNDTKTAVEVEKTLAKIVKRILEEKDLLGKKGLIVGLGNINVTPDALGPYVIDNIIVTRHLYTINKISDGFSNVCALAPGVMGTTGLETYDIILSIIKNIDCDYVIAIDALATSSIARVCKVIQITDSGINPGSGVKNQRKELSEQTLGIPVIALGVPTVVDSVTITHDIIEYVFRHLQDINEEKLFGEFGKLDESNKRMLIEGILEPNGINMMVTPKEIDSEIEELTKIIANGLDLALHPGLYNGMSE